MRTRHLVSCVLVASAVCLHFRLFDWESRGLRTSPYEAASPEAVGIWPDDQVTVTVALAVGVAVPLAEIALAAYLSRRFLAAALAAVWGRMGLAHQVLCHAADPTETSG